jgi:hypothetical protein
VQFPGDLNGDGAPDLLLSEASNIGHDGAVYMVSAPSPDFIRGDANGDGRVEISDPVAVMGKLFLGNPTPLCQDGADADDDGVLSVTDLIYLLSHLFLGGLAPPAVSRIRQRPNRRSTRPQAFLIPHGRSLQALRRRCRMSPRSICERRRAGCEERGRGDLAEPIVEAERQSRRPPPPQSGGRFVLQWRLTLRIEQPRQVLPRVAPRRTGSTSGLGTYDGGSSALPA